MWKIKNFSRINIYTRIFLRQSFDVNRNNKNNNNKYNNVNIIIKIKIVC